MTAVVEELAPDPLPAELIRAASARFGLPREARIEFMRHGENTTYGITAPDGRRFALRINRPGYQTPDAIRSEVAWMERLRRSGIRTPVAIAGVDGDPLQNATAQGWSRTAVLFEWVDGVPLTGVDDVQPWARLGALMARIHVLTRDWTPPAWFTRPAWDGEALVGDEPRWGRPDPERRLAPADRAALEACRAEVRTRLDAIGTGADRFGLIHSDLAFENVLVADDGEVVIIDFDDSGYGWYLHELAVVLYPHEGTGGFGERRDALVDGYRGVREAAGRMAARVADVFDGPPDSNPRLVVQPGRHRTRARPARASARQHPGGGAQVSSLGERAPGVTQAAEDKVL